MGPRTWLPPYVEQRTERGGTLSGCQKTTTSRVTTPAASLPHGAILGAMNLGNIARVLTVATACLAAAGSATSNNNSPAVQPQTANTSPPPPQAMDPARALGLWRSTFGAVKIEADSSK